MFKLFSKTQKEDKALITPTEFKQIDDKERYKVACSLNLATVSVSQIIDYDDAVILDQEYDAILNNLNLENIIHDEPLLTVFRVTCKHPCLI